MIGDLRSLVVRKRQLGVLDVIGVHRIHTNIGSENPAQDHLKRYGKLD